MKAKAKKSKAKKVAKDAKKTKAPKSKAKEAKTFDLNPTNEVGRNETPTKVWAQFPCNASNNLAIQAHLKGQGYRTFASYVVGLIVKDGVKDLKTSK